LRGLLLALLSARAERVALIRHDPGWRTLLGLRAVFGRRRKLVALHFIEPRPVRGLRGRADRWATRRALLVGQVLTDAERVAYARRYDLPKERFAQVGFARRSAPALPPSPANGIVLAAGRAECDWPTLFAAARGAGWPLVVVCSTADLPEVERRNADGVATVHCELGREETRALLRDAAVAVIAMHDSGASQGHVRLMEAVDAGATVVATNVAALRGYVVDGETGLMVPEGDAAALRTAVDRLLADPALRERLRKAAFERAGAWTWADYLAAVERLVVSAAPARSR
jgi:glycosyltransferase involved in cell wall biosynthesis